MTGAHGDLLGAWDKESGPETARKLMRSALDDAIGRKSVIVDRKGVPHDIVVKDWEPLRTILPYIARKMPEAQEHSGPDGEPIIINLNPFPKTDGL